MRLTMSNYVCNDCGADIQAITLVQHIQIHRGLL